jgi:hypothetical protein
VKEVFVQTFGLMNGDLTIDGTGGYGLVSGAARIRQDLTLALLEDYGTDRFHPKYGSTVKNFLGNTINEEIMQLVRGEVNRVVQNYIIVQQAAVIRDTQYDIAGRFDTSDVVRGVTGIEVRTNLDTVFVSVALVTLNRETITVNRQLGL